MYLRKQFVGLLCLFEFYVHTGLVEKNCLLVIGGFGQLFTILKSD